MALLRNNTGFSLVEVLVGMAVFMIGMLGVIALQISATWGSNFAADFTEATALAEAQMEALMLADYDDSGLAETTSNTAGTLDGIDSDTVATADHNEVDQGKNQKFDVFWNMAVDVPIPNLKTIKVIVKWSEKGDSRSVNIKGVKGKNKL